MPRGDRTGPTGAGAMTGRGLGYCAGYPVPRYAAAGYGCGRGAGGYGGGRGFRHRYYATGVPGWGRAMPAPAYPPPAGYAAPAPPAPREEATALRAESEYLATALDEIKARLAELESGNDE